MNIKQMSDAEMVKLATGPRRPQFFDAIRKMANERTSPEVASLAGKILGMTTADKITAFNESDETAEALNNAVNSVAASALNQAD